ncbi:MAG: alpha/beta hydrolase [Nanoarchaeota archaeon]|nr:alpha/beta hydrolase [Nanoarchaeota archaeon]MBU1269902.1 alpha/beta hydrolase [Nanoarchaeota archaeon]MBU1604143.1 alpha/beta hydrolase [Nanoarchaeota archaeon]MBU2443267.1 alpha/beta hydrolase [Nanoarchaeota archaeon]
MVKIIKTGSFGLAAYIKGSRNSEKLALILPGRLDTKDYKHIKSHVNFLAKKNYLAVSFDPPGTWESSGEIASYSMTNYLKSINELIEYFGNKQTVLIGHSRGGTMAMLAGTQNDHVTHIISIMSRPSPSPINKNTKETGFEISFRDTPSDVKKKFHLPLNYFMDALKYDVTNDISKCNKPKMFIFGARDKIISPDIVKETYKNAAGPKQLFGVECDHDYRLHPKIIKEINILIWEFLKNNNLQTLR